MIDHEHKCIFIHIQRTGGTSIEQWLVGNDWWFIEPQTKHLLASQAKEIYAPYWNSYFKFAFLRDPVSRFYSALEHQRHFGLKLTDQNDLVFDGYYELFGRETILEYDYRFHDRASLERQTHEQRTVYRNLLDEDMDFVGRFENLKEDTRFLQKELGVKIPFDVHIERSKKPVEPSPSTRRYIEEEFRLDFDFYESV